MKDDEFQGPESKNFVGSIYNFSANIEQNGGGSCPNCVQQKKEGIKSVAQIPATLAAQGYLKDNPNNKEIPLYYAGVDHLGQVSIPSTFYSLSGFRILINGFITESQHKSYCSAFSR